MISKDIIPMVSKVVMPFNGIYIFMHDDNICAVEAYALAWIM